MGRLLAGGVVVIAVALAGCGSSQDPTRRHLATYLAAVNRIERQLATPLKTVDTIDGQLTARADRRGAGDTTSAGRLTTAAQERGLQQATAQIQAVTIRLRALTAPAPAAHLKGLLVEIAGRQAELAVQTQRLISFIPGFSRSLRPLGPAVVSLERVLSVNHAYGAGAVAAVYARKAAALRSFVRTLGAILASLARLQPPISSLPTYQAESRSLRRMGASATTLAGDLAGGHTTQIAGVLQSFDRAAALPGSVPAQRAEAGAVRAYDRQVGQLSTLVADANRERLRLAKRYP